jgi:hypothetical protein
MSTTPILPHLDFRCRTLGGVSSEPPPRRGVGDARSPRCRYAQAVLGTPVGRCNTISSWRRSTIQMVNRLIL